MMCGPTLTTWLTAVQHGFTHQSVYLNIPAPCPKPSHCPGGSQTVFECDQSLAAKTLVMPPFPEDRFLCAFFHIFAGPYDYSAGYYRWVLKHGSAREGQPLISLHVRKHSLPQFPATWAFGMRTCPNNAMLSHYGCTLSEASTQIIKICLIWWTFP